MVRFLIQPPFPANIESDLGVKIKEELKRQELHLNYDPLDSVYRPWYKIPYKVNFRKKVWPRGARTNLLLRRISIASLKRNGEDRTINDLIDAITHETGHIDIAPVGIPLLWIGLIYTYNRFDDPIKGLIVTAGATVAYYFIIKELVVHAYNTLKYGAKKYWSL